MRTISFLFVFCIVGLMLASCGSGQSDAIIWNEVAGHQVVSSMKSDPPRKVEFKYVVGKDGTLQCTGWKDLSGKNSAITVTGKIIDIEGNEVISFVKIPVTLRLNENATNPRERVFFEFFPTEKWRVRSFVGYETKTYQRE